MPPTPPRLVAAFAVLLLLAPCAFGEDESASAAALLQIGDDTFRTRDYAGATAIYKRAIAAAEKEKAEETLVEALAMAARGHAIRKQFEEGKPYLDRAAKLVNEKQPLGWSRYLGVRGRFEWQMEKDKPKATKTFEAMHAYCLKHELWRRAVDAAHMVAITGTADQQIAWGLKGIEAAEKGEMEGWLGPLWNNLGNSYQERGEYEKAVSAFLTARVWHWKGKDEHRKLVADWAVGMAYQRCNKLKEAKAWLRPVLAWAERRYTEKPGKERGEWIGLAYAQLGFVAVKEGRKEDARRDLARAYPLLHAVDMASWDAKGWKELEDAYVQVNGGGEKGTRALELLRSHMSARRLAVRTKETRARMASIGQAIDMYRLANKKLPDSLEVLTETDGRNPHPYIKSVPDDAWGNAFEYRVIDRSTYQMRSHGRDGKANTPDDVAWSNR